MAELACAKDMRLNTHLCEMVNDETYCREHLNRDPIEYMESARWIGPHVWFAGAVQLEDTSIAKMVATRMGRPTARRPMPEPAQASPASAR